ncbi:Nucleolar protein 9 [Heterocephalus glaber]|uniref:Nucleolar protein 9 n=1 Tax=Heterocephalus glaber TaxID=10181 RepID=G5BSR0_HETGA|nr:Nucleolar protein 9 [Heterocephalus glaber]
MPEKSKKEIKTEAWALLRVRLNLEDRSWAMENFSPLCSIVLLEHVKTTTINFIASRPGLSTIFVQEKEASQVTSECLVLVSVVIKTENRKRGLQLTESTLAALEELVSVSFEDADGCPIVLVCGAQDMGKSTFNRYLINQLLNSTSCVDYLECDLGQTEFTPPGCISLLNITEPVLGPPYTHQRTPQKMVYYGKPSCKNSFENYIDIIKYVFGAYKREAPLIVNTMGWEFSESLEFADEEKDSPVLFTEHKLLSVYSEFSFRKTAMNRDSHNKIFRDLTVLAYLAQLLAPVPKPLGPLHGLAPYQVPFNAIALRFTHSDVAPTHILYAVNGSWLGLCQILDDVRGYSREPILLAQMPICDCVGFGVCRGIDMEKRLYHILTSVPPEELRSMNCLLVGAVSIPQCVFKSQHGLEGTVPYVPTDYNFKLPGASEKIRVRDSEKEQLPKGKLYSKSKFCWKMQFLKGKDHLSQPVGSGEGGACDGVRPVWCSEGLGVLCHSPVTGPRPCSATWPRALPVWGRFLQQWEGLDPAHAGRIWPALQKLL